MACGRSDDGVPLDAPSPAVLSSYWFERAPWQRARCPGCRPVFCV